MKNLKDIKFWLITDTHFNHNKMTEYCGRPEGFEEIIFKNLQKMIGPEDVLIHLGDVCIGKDAEMHEKYIKPINCMKWLVVGNHDGKSNQWYLRHGWDFVAKSFGGTYFGQKVIFSHIPVTVVLEGTVNIHGHFHNRLERAKFVVGSGESDRDAEILSMMNDRHKLLSIEETDYKPVELINFLNG